MLNSKVTRFHTLLNLLILCHLEIQKEISDEKKQIRFYRFCHLPCHPAVLWLAAGNHAIKVGTCAVINVVPSNKVSSCF